MVWKFAVWAWGTQGDASVPTHHPRSPRPYADNEPLPEGDRKGAHN